MKGDHATHPKHFVNIEEVEERVIEGMPTIDEGEIELDSTMEEHGKNFMGWTFEELEAARNAMFFLEGQGGTLVDSVLFGIDTVVNRTGIVKGIESQHDGKGGHSKRHAGFKRIAAAALEHNLGEAHGLLSRDCTSYLFLAAIGQSHVAPIVDVFDLGVQYREHVGQHAEDCNTKVSSNRPSHPRRPAKFGSIVRNKPGACVFIPWEGKNARLFGGENTNG